MLTGTNVIFDSTVAAKGQWRDISNWVAFSIHFQNLEGKVWIEVSNDAAVLTDANIAGVNITQPDIITAAATQSEEDQLVYNSSTKQAIYSPSCLVYHYIRVVKDNTAQTIETKAFLFGQQG